jgi:nucleotide-binding universal stress UspA family protein
VYQRILLPLDGSELAEIAIPHTIALASLADADVLVVQVVESVSHVLSAGLASPADLTVETAQELVAVQTQEASEYLESVRERMAREGATRIRIAVLQGRASEELEQVIAAEQRDVVVMATHGRSGVSRAVLGSVADHVVRHSPGCSVLLVDAQDRV